MCSFVVLGIGVGVVETSLDFVVDDFLSCSECRFETSSESVEAFGADCLLLATSFGVLVLVGS